VDITEYLDRIAKSEDIPEILKIADEAIEDEELIVEGKMLVFSRAISRSNVLQGNSCPLRTNAG